MFVVHEEFEVVVEASNLSETPFAVFGPLPWFASFNSVILIDGALFRKYPRPVLCVGVPN